MPSCPKSSPLSRNAVLAFWCFYNRNRKNTVEIRWVKSVAYVRIYNAINSEQPAAKADLYPPPVVFLASPCESRVSGYRWQSQLVKQRYGPELRNKTVASLKSEISIAMSPLLDELKSIEENRVLRTATPFPTRPRSSHPKRAVKSCILCKTANHTGIAPYFFCLRQIGISWDAHISFLVMMMMTLLMTLNVSLQKMRNVPYLIPIYTVRRYCTYNHHTWVVSIINIQWESPWIQALLPIWCPTVWLPALISPSNLHLSLHARLMVMHPLMWSVKSVVPFITMTAASALMLWWWWNWMSMSSQAIPSWLSMTLRHVPQNGRWLWEVKTLSAMMPLQHAMCLSGGLYCSQRHQNKQW